MGDRFQDRYHLDIWEYTGGYSDSEVFPHSGVCIQPTLSADYEIGNVDNWDFDSSYWIFLGNFAKSKNITNLYSILNEPQ